MKRFLLFWIVLSPAYLFAAALSSWLVLNLLDLTFAAIASWLVVPPAQALVLSLARRDAGPRPASGRPPAAAIAGAAAGAVLLAVGLLRAHASALGMAAPGGLQPAIRRLVLLAAGALFVAAAARARRGARLPSGALGVFLALVGADVFVPWLAAAPAWTFRLKGVFVPSAIVYGGLLAAGTVLALATRPGREEAPWTARLLDTAIATAFVTAHAAALNYTKRPWLSPPWDALVPAGATATAILLGAAGLALISEGSSASRREAAA